MDVLRCFRRVNDYSRLSGYESGFANCEQAIVGDDVVFGGFMLDSSKATVRDMSFDELGNPDTVGARFRAVFNASRTQGFIGGFPNGHQAMSNGVRVLGTVLLNHQDIVVRDITRSELGNPNTDDALIRSINRLARSRGFASGLPNFHQANHGNGVVYGCLLFNQGTIVPVDVPRKTREELEEEYLSYFNSLTGNEFGQVCSDCATTVVGGFGTGSTPQERVRNAAIGAVTSRDCRDCVKETARRAKAAADEAAQRLVQIERERIERINRERFERIDRMNYDAERYERWRDTDTMIS